MQEFGAETAYNIDLFVICILEYTSEVWKLHRERRGEGRFFQFSFEAFDVV